jgi:hypothetical protein
MQQLHDVVVPQRNRRVFHIAYLATVFLLVSAIVIASIQKSYESAAVMAVAKAVATGNNVSRHGHVAGVLSIVNLAAFVLAVLSCGIALRYREKYRWTWVPIIVLFVFYVFLALIMV